MLAEEPIISVQQWYLLVGVALLVVLYFATRHGRRKLDGSPKQYRREIDGALRDSAVVQRDLESLLVELNELAGTIGGQMDARIVRLQSMLKEADARISELRKLLDRADASRMIDPSNADGDQSMAERVAIENVRSTKLDWIVDDEAARSVRHEADEIIVTRNTARERRPPAEEPQDEMELFNRRVCRLADEGLSPVQIAEMAKRTVGEIELILHLQRRTRRHAGASGQV